MIRTAHVNAAIALAGKLDAMNYRLLPVVNTPLSSLNSDLAIDHVLGTNNEYTPNPQFYVASANATTPGQEMSVFTANMDHTARTIATYVQSHLSFAKNVVNPLISELVECFTQKVNSFNISPTNDFKLVKMNLPLPMLESDVKDAIDDYAKIDAVNFSYPKFNAPELSIVEVVELMKTGNKRADTAIESWVATVGEGVIMQAYMRMFSTPKGWYPRNHVIGTQADSWDSTLAVFLMTRNLLDKPWEGCDMSLVNYNNAIATVRDHAGVTLNAIYNSFASSIKTNTLIVSSFGNTIVVNASVYEDWIAEGNNDLTLFAVLVTGKRINFVSEINAVKVELMKAWELHAAMAASSERNRKYAIMKKTLHECVFQLIEQNAANVFGHLNNGITGADHIQMKEYKTFVASFDQYYASLSEADFNDIWCVAKCIVCDQLFYYTDAGTILDGIEDACKNNPDMGVDEAALLSTISYVSKYVSGQMVLSKF